MFCMPLSTISGFRYSSFLYGCHSAKMDSWSCKNWTAAHLFYRGRGERKMFSSLVIDIQGDTLRV